MFEKLTFSIMILELEKKQKELIRDNKKISFSEMKKDFYK